MYTTKIRTNFYDADPAGILFYANIYKLAHSAYEEMIKSWGIGEDVFFSPEFAMPITHSEADYLLPILVHEELTININASKLKKHSFELSYFFYSYGELKAKVKTVHVFVDKKEMKKFPIPEPLRIKFGAI
ncbi:acyl-CoA thioesterase [Bacteroidota bacterium]